MRVDERTFLCRWPMQKCLGRVSSVSGRIRLSKRLFFWRLDTLLARLMQKHWRIDQIPHSDEVVSSARKGEHPSDLVHAAMSGLTQHSDYLQPTEYLLDPFPLNLTYFVSGVSRGAPINGAAARRLSFCAT